LRSSKRHVAQRVLKEHERAEEQQKQIAALNSTVAIQEALIAQEKQELHATIARQDKEIRALIATLKEQVSQIEKVSAQVEMDMPGTKIAEISQQHDR